MQARLEKVKERKRQRGELVEEDEKEEEEEKEKEEPKEEPKPDTTLERDSAPKETKVREWDIGKGMCAIMMIIIVDQLLCFCITHNSFCIICIIHYVIQMRALIHYRPFYVWIMLICHYYFCLLLYEFDQKLLPAELYSGTLL